MVVDIFELTLAKVRLQEYERQVDPRQQRNELYARSHTHTHRGLCTAIKIRLIKFNTQLCAPSVHGNTNMLIL